MAELPNQPVTRQEMYLSRLAGENTTLPVEPLTREEMYLEGAIDRVEAVEEEVEEMKNNPDVADIVATYADLQVYDTSKLTDKDVIRVLADENHNDDSTYYRFSKSDGTFTYIGESKQYTDFTGATSSANGTNGLVPAPLIADIAKFLRGDGTWAEVSGGGVVELTSADYDYPANNPTSVALWKKPAGMYYWDNGVSVRPNNSESFTNGMSAVVFEGAGTSLFYVDIITFYGPGAKNTIQWHKTRYSDGAVVNIGNYPNVNILSSASIQGVSGTSISDVMSQNATTSMVYADPQARTRVQLGANAAAGGLKTIAVGEGASAQYLGSVAFGFGARTSAVGEMNIGLLNVGEYWQQQAGYKNTPYRLLTGLYDGQSAHDAATVAQGNTLATDAPTTTTVGVLGQLYTDTTTMHTYQCTAIDTTDPNNPSYTWTQRW